MAFSNAARVIIADHNFTAINAGHAHKYFVAGYFIAHVQMLACNKIK